MILLKPNEHDDWINKRNSKFEEFIPMESEQKFVSKTNSFFNVYSLGINSNRDVWVYNLSKDTLSKNMKNMFLFIILKSMS